MAPKIVKSTKKIESVETIVLSDSDDDSSPSDMISMLSGMADSDEEYDVFENKVKHKKSRRKSPKTTYCRRSQQLSAQNPVQEAAKVAVVPKKVEVRSIETQTDFPLQNLSYKQLIECPECGVEQDNARKLTRHMQMRHTRLLRVKIEEQLKKPVESHLMYLQMLNPDLKFPPKREVNSSKVLVKQDNSYNYPEISPKNAEESQDPVKQQDPIELTKPCYKNEDKTEEKNVPVKKNECEKCKKSFKYGIQLRRHKIKCGIKPAKESLETKTETEKIMRKRKCPPLVEMPTPGPDDNSQNEQFASPILPKRRRYRQLPDLIIPDLSHDALKNPTNRSVSKKSSRKTLASVKLEPSILDHYPVFNARRKSEGNGGKIQDFLDRTCKRCHKCFKSVPALKTHLTRSKTRPGICLEPSLTGEQLEKLQKLNEKLTELNKHSTFKS